MILSCSSMIGEVIYVLILRRKYEITNIMMSEKMAKGTMKNLMMSLPTVVFTALILSLIRFFGKISINVYSFLEP